MMGCLWVLSALAVWTMVSSASERALGPLVAAQPLVAAGGVGLLLGRPAEAATAGVMLQALWPGFVPMGGSRVPSEALAGLSAGLWASLLPAGAVTLLGALAMGLLAGWTGSLAEEWLRRRNGERLHAALEGRLGVGRAVFQGLLEAAFRGPVMVGLAALMALGLRRHLPISIGDGVMGAVVALGLGVAARRVLGWRAILRDGRKRQEDLGSAHAPPSRCLRGVWSSLLVQSAFSDSYLQLGGFLWAVRRFTGESAELATAAGAANTHPVMAAALIGAAERSRLAGASVSEVGRILRRAGPPLAAWGDAFIWGIFRPAVLLLAVALGVRWPLLGASLLGALGLAADVGARCASWRWGWQQGQMVGSRPPGLGAAAAGRLLMVLCLVASLASLGALVLDLRTSLGWAALLLVVGWFILGASSPAPLRRPMGVGLAGLIAGASGLLLN